MSESKGNNLRHNFNVLIRYLFIEFSLALVFFAGAQEWQAYKYTQKGLVPTSQTTFEPQISNYEPCLFNTLPSSWDVRRALVTSVTDEPSCLLLIWRPWRDLPIMRWSKYSKSPVLDFRDSLGDSAHIAVIQANLHSYKEIWVSSALPIPIKDIAVADIDADGNEELIALETSYDKGRTGEASYFSIWDWNGFGFILSWRSEQGSFQGLALAKDEHQMYILVR